MLKKPGSIIFLSMLAFMFMVSCSSVEKGYHGYIMRGTILESSGKDVYLCIGSRDGAKAGDEFTVYKNKLISTKETSDKTQQRWAREETGKVKIMEIVNEHYAKGTILSGKAEVNSVVELK